MGICCDLQVDVNGEEIFYVDKRILVSFSGRLSKLFGKAACTTSPLRVIFHDFPGGAKGFELVVRFCYNNGRIDMTPYNIILLHCAANFMEMKGGSSRLPDLIDQMEKYFKGIHRWTWSELVLCLKQCQDLSAVPSSSTLLQKFLNMFVAKLVFLNVASPCASTSDKSSSQFSSDISGDSIKSYSSQATWWFEDLKFLNINWFEKVVHEMMSKEFDHPTICSFIFYYQRSNFLGASPATEKGKIIETVINLLFSLDKSSISSRGLFCLFSLAVFSKVSKSCKMKLEAMVGSKLDEAKIDNLLIPSPRGKKYMYDVNLILRLLKSFLLENQFSTGRLDKVACLMELYLAEVSADPYLKPSKFMALATSLPDFSRGSQNRIYLAIDMYLKVHSGLCQEEKMKVWSILKCEKHSAESLIDLAKNYKLEPRGACTSQRFKHKSLFQDTKHIRFVCNDSRFFAEHFLLYSN
ncbi:BTB/POZ domain-containing protein At3g22104-like [Rhododendron vialii]|uniref:BTB/POZ domain-containing protein At3g22104-like n=1 Tax=Rhododendron vialii TaxID=182163 RepID=UPI00265E3E25|nr:BTB/POZ domain-containing protein At3g22104-like [Rhododendron vialii]